ncbi:hypothetical protein L7F22_025712 [Adiantum nelumboides]|nr:hypothetical protein [Adiantum nelumboides]
MVAEMADPEADDALVVQSFLDACTSEQSSELVVQESMPDKYVERSCSRDAQRCESSTLQMAVTDDSVIQTFLDMLDREHVDAFSLDSQEMHVADTPCQSEMPIAKDIYVDACSVELASGVKEFSRVIYNPPFEYHFLGHYADIFIVTQSVLGFLKVVVARQPAEHLQQHLKSIVEGLLLWSDDSKNHFKAKVRVIFEMLVRRCGLQAVSAVTPEQHAKLLTHIRKMRDRKEKKEGDDSKSVKSQATTARQSRWQHTQFFSDDDDDVGSDDNNTAQLTVASAQKSRASSTRSNRRLRKLTKMLPEDEWDGENEPLDLLDTHKTRSVLASNKLKRKNYDSDDLEVDPEGRLIIPADETKAKGKTKHFEDQDTAMPSVKSAKTAGKFKPKVHATKKRKTETGWAYTGQEYASKKGARRGDVKQQGKLDPYAYWPLDPKMLNRREGKKAVARKGLASVVKTTNKMKGLSTSEALGLKHSFKGAPGSKHAKGKQKFHKSKGKGKRK